MYFHLLSQEESWFYYVLLLGSGFPVFRSSNFLSCWQWSERWKSLAVIGSGGFTVISELESRVLNLRAEINEVLVAAASAFNEVPDKVPVLKGVPVDEQQEIRPATKVPRTQNWSGGESDDGVVESKKENDLTAKAIEDSASPELPAAQVQAQIDTAQEPELAGEAAASNVVPVPVVNDKIDQADVTTPQETTGIAEVVAKVDIKERVQDQEADTMTIPEPETEEYKAKEGGTPEDHVPDAVDAVEEANKDNKEDKEQAEDVEAKDEFQDDSKKSPEDAEHGEKAEQEGEVTVTDGNDDSGQEENDEDEKEDVQHVEPDPAADVPTEGGDQTADPSFEKQPQPPPAKKLLRAQGSEASLHDFFAPVQTQFMIASADANAGAALGTQRKQETVTAEMAEPKDNEKNEKKKDKKEKKTKDKDKKDKKASKKEKKDKTETEKKSDGNKRKRGRSADPPAKAKAKAKAKAAAAPKNDTGRGRGKGGRGRGHGKETKPSEAHADLHCRLSQ